MLSRIYSSIILGINILIGLVLLCFNAEFYHNPSWIITIEQEQKYLLNWNMAFALIIIFYNLILLLLVDSLLLSKRPHLFFTYGLICSVCLLAIHLTNTILFVFVSTDLKPTVDYILSQPEDLALIQLKEIEPKYPLLELFSITNQLVKSNSLHSTSNKPKTQNLQRVIPQLFEIEVGCCGSDPITHKKIKDENIDETSNNIAQVQSTSTTVSSTSSNTQTKMDDTTEQQSESSMKREK
ncbi:unnamed protein product [Rotaria sp. Silwood1]|nr:unnamed protein product [Rotaria sp. Silwood1]